MRRLYVLRHAKSSWDDPALADRDRPLSSRGRGAASRIAVHIEAEGIDPGLVLCSPALRTRETLEAIAPALLGTEVRIEPELYGAGEDELLARLRRLPADVGSVLVIGHNPGLELLVLHVARPGPARDRVREKFPTGALATLEVAGTWSELGEDGAELVAYVVPRGLE